MGKIRSKEEIDAEIAALKGLRTKVRRFSVFNDDNRAAIDMQITVLKERLTPNQMYARHGEIAWTDPDTGEVSEDYIQHEFGAGLEAVHWMWQEKAQKEAPSVGWKGLT